LNTSNIFKTASGRPGFGGPLVRSNGADFGDAPPEQAIRYASSFRLSRNSGDLKRDHFTFNGWNTEPDGTGTSYNVGVAVSARHISHDTTLYAQWRELELITLYYDVYVNLGGYSGARLLEALEAVASSADIFREHFAIDFVLYDSGVSLDLNPNFDTPGFPCVDPTPTGTCSSLCGPTPVSLANCMNHHHRSADKLINALSVQDGSRYVFRFVDFELCAYTRFGPNDPYGHYPLGGLARFEGWDMIISTVTFTTTPALENITVHEISHNLGADHFGNRACDPTQDCVLNSFSINDEWCHPCRTSILEHRKVIG
jgi:hypothetical protein